MAERSILGLNALDNNTVEISIGEERAVLTPDEVTQLIFGLVNARSLINPPVLKDDPEAEQAVFSSTDEMRLSLWPSKKEQGGVLLGFGVQGLGVVVGAIPADKARDFQRKLFSALHNPDVTPA